MIKTSNHNDKKKKKKRKKKSPFRLLDLQFTHCGIKTNLEVSVVCKKNNLVAIIKFYPLT
jgi:hypothetical protein